MNFSKDIQNNGIMLTIRTALEQVGELPAPCINDASCLPTGKVRCCSNAWNVIKNAMTPDAQWSAYQSVAPGQINAQGLTDLGEFALGEMMKMGIMIDLDHMGRKSITKALEIAEGFNGGYPVNLGHNHIRHDNGSGTERNISAFTANRVAKLGGMIGVGTADLRSDVFIVKYIEMLAAAGNNGDLFVAPGIGSDANGLEPLPAKPLGLESSKFYSNGFTKYGIKDVTGNYYKTWDYTKEGVAHYGLMTDFFQDVKTRGDGWGSGVYDRVMMSAEYFARMWEKCEDRAGVN
jgi:hypothetical protein